MDEYCSVYLQVYNYGNLLVQQLSGQIYDQFSEAIMEY